MVRSKVITTGEKRKRIIIIGSGWSGLYAIKWIKEELRITNPTLYEDWPSVPLSSFPTPTSTTHNCNTSPSPPPHNNNNNNNHAQQQQQQPPPILGGGGGGVSQQQHQVLVLEKEGEIGGVWNYKENEEGGVYRGTCSTSSKTYMHPSDYPFPDEYPQFPHHSLIIKHLQRYANHFHLLPFISYHKLLLHLHKPPLYRTTADHNNHNSDDHNNDDHDNDNAINNTWELIVLDMKSGEIKALYADYVITAVGQHQNPNWSSLFASFQSPSHPQHYHPCPLSSPLSFSSIPSTHLPITTTTTTPTPTPSTTTTTTINDITPPSDHHHPSSSFPPTSSSSCYTYRELSSLALRYLPPPPPPPSSSSHDDDDCNDNMRCEIGSGDACITTTPVTTATTTTSTSFPLTSEGVIKQNIASLHTFKNRYEGDVIFESFTGHVMHAHGYKYPTEEMRGKRVLIIGGGESASDIANEVSVVTKKCILSIRNGVWFHDRSVGGRQPADILFTRHQRAAGNYESFPIWVGRHVLIEVVWGRGGSGITEWLPSSQYLHGFINKSRDVVTKVNLGMVIPKRSIAKIKGDYVYFHSPPSSSSSSSRHWKGQLHTSNNNEGEGGEDDDQEVIYDEEGNEGHKVDMIILAIGYQSNIIHLFKPLPPTLISKFGREKEGGNGGSDSGISSDDDDDIIHDAPLPCVDIKWQRGNARWAYKLVFDVNDPTLILLGNVRPVFGSIPGLVELQARWVARVIAQKCKLPSTRRMKKIVKRDLRRSRRIYPIDNSRLFQLVNHFEYSDVIAELAGLKPNFPRYLFTNPKLWWTLITSPWTPFHYNLVELPNYHGDQNHALQQKQRIQTSLKEIEKSIEKEHYALIFFNNLVLFLDFVLFLFCVLSFLFIYVYFIKQ